MWALAAATALLAGFVRGFSGFGAALILMPALSALTAPQIAIPVLQLIDTIAASPLAVRAWPKSRPAEIAPMLAGYALALPLGLLVLIYTDPALLTRIIAVFVLAVAAVIGLGYRNLTPPGPLATVAVGAAAGGCSGAVGIGGPPVVLFWLAGRDGAATVRANIMVFFVLSGFIALAGLAVAGLLTMETVRWALAIGPAYALGLWLGAKFFDPAREKLYRRFALFLVACVGALALIAG